MEERLETLSQDLSDDEDLRKSTPIATPSMMLDHNKKSPDKINEEF
jgi:hypothetical protein